MGWTKRFPAENILLDVSLLIVAFLLPSANWLLSRYLTAAFWIAAPLQVVALFCAFYGGAGRGGRKLPDWLSSIYIVNIIFAVGGFLWLFFVAFAVEKQTGGFPNWGFRFCFFVALFGGIFAFGMGSQMGGDGEMPITTRALLVLAILIYLSFTESLLEVSIGISKPGILTIILITFISYLPVRLALAFQPPFSYWDLTSAVVSFGAYLSSLVSR